MAEDNLIVDIVAAQYGLTQDITAAALDSMERRALRAEAELEIIRNRFTTLLHTGYAPSSEAIMEAMWPCYEEIEQRVSEMKGNLNS